MSSDFRVDCEDCRIDMWYESLEGGLPDMTISSNKPFELMHIHPDELKEIYKSLKELFS